MKKSVEITWAMQSGYPPYEWTITPWGGAPMAISERLAERINSAPMGAWITGKVNGKMVDFLIGRRFA